MKGRVVWVVDGDTIHVRVGPRLEKVRYIGVNAPERSRTPKREAGAREAHEPLRSTGDSWPAGPSAWGSTSGAGTPTGGSSPTCGCGERGGG